MADIQDLAIAANNNTARFPEGMAVSTINNSARELEAILARFSKDISGANVSTGSGTAYLLEPYRTVAALEAGLLMVWRANTACGDAPTFAVDGLTAKPLTDANDRNLTTGDIISGQVVVSVYNATTDAWECQGIKTTLPRYAVASLPTGVAGQLAYATNGRANGEGAGLGTGVLVYSNGTVWRACDTGATVAA